MQETYDINKDTEILNNDLKVYKSRLLWTEYTIDKIEWELWRRERVLK